ncbi:MAG: family oxidoreductase, partial [Bacteroidetes bacterium]|nr:family oxidoreductase [Bacteroidota bacterium]
MTENKKIALITGSSRGLGKDMALCLAKKNVDIVITYATNKDAAEGTVKEIEALGSRAFAVNFDLKNSKNIDPFILSLTQQIKENFNADTFDFLINNAGMGATVPFEKVTENMFDEFLNVHYKGVYFLTQKC